MSGHVLGCFWGNIFFGKKLKNWPGINLEGVFVRSNCFGKVGFQFWETFLFDILSVNFSVIFWSTFWQILLLNFWLTFWSTCWETFGATFGPFFKKNFWRTFWTTFSSTFGQHFGQLVLQHQKTAQALRFAASELRLTSSIKQHQREKSTKKSTKKSSKKNIKN